MNGGGGTNTGRAENFRRGTGAATVDGSIGGAADRGRFELGPVDLRRRERDRVQTCGSARSRSGARPPPTRSAARDRSPATATPPRRPTRVGRRRCGPGRRSLARRCRPRRSASATRSTAGPPRPHPSPDPEPLLPDVRAGDVCVMRERRTWRRPSQAARSVKPATTTSAIGGPPVNGNAPLLELPDEPLSATPLGESVPVSPADASAFPGGGGRRRRGRVLRLGRRRVGRGGRAPLRGRGPFDGCRHLEARGTCRRRDRDVTGVGHDLLARVT